MTSYGYDGDGHVTLVTDNAGNTTYTAYDSRGNVVFTQDALTHTTSMVYDKLDRLIASIDGDGHATSYGYDADGNRTSVTDPDSNVTSFGYDQLDRNIATTTYLESGTTSVALVAHYGYDDDGDLTASEDQNGNLRTFAYDLDDRMTQEAWFAAGVGTAYRTINTTYVAGKDLTASVSDGTTGYSYYYDSLERVTSVIEDLGSTSTTIDFTMGYDADDNRIYLADSLGDTQASTYDADNRLSTLTGSDMYVTFGYDAAGRVTSELQNGYISTSTTYDAVGRVSTIVARQEFGPWIDAFAYSYDAASRLASETDIITTDYYSPSITATTAYGYDDAGQLTSATGVSYSYDAAGNRNGGGSTAGSDNRLMTDGTWNYSYDADGNEVGKTSVADSKEFWTYQYDNRNELVTAIHDVDVSGTSTVELEVDYGYDVLGNRISETDKVTPAGGSTTTTTTLFVQDGWNPAKAGSTGNSNFDVWADLNADGSLKNRYLNGDQVDQHLATTHFAFGTSLVEDLVLDYQNSVRAMVEPSGSIDDQIAYDPFGNATDTTPYPTLAVRYGWQGRERDFNTGLQYGRARYYDPTTARWMSQDPLGFDAGDSNLYRYVNNAPTDGVDPSGFEGEGGENSKTNTQNGSVESDSGPTVVVLEIDEQKLSAAVRREQGIVDSYKGAIDAAYSEMQKLEADFGSYRDEKRREKLDEATVRYTNLVGDLSSDLSGSRKQPDSMGSLLSIPARPRYPQLFDFVQRDRKGRLSGEYGYVPLNVGWLRPAPTEKPAKPDAPVYPTSMMENPSDTEARHEYLRNRNEFDNLERLRVEGAGTDQTTPRSKFQMDLGAKVAAYERAHPSLGRELVGMVPILGPAIGAIEAFHDGNTGLAFFNLVMLGLDVLPMLKPVLVLRGAGRTAPAAGAAALGAGSVVELEVGQYGNLARRSVRDGLTPDHIPSFAAVRTNVERELGRELTAAEARTLRDQTNAIVVRTRSHQQVSRTYGGRNTAQQIRADSQNLQGAFQLDRDAWRQRLINEGHSPQAVDEAFRRLDELNRQSGRY